MSATRSQRLQKSFLKYQHIFVFAAPAVFVTVVLFAAPTGGSGGMDYWLEYWWLFPFFLLGATTVNTVGISGSALFVPFLIFIFPVLAGETLTPETLVKVGLISESFGLSSSAIAFIQYGLVDRRLALTIVGGSIPFVIAGALLSFVIPEPIFNAALGAALLTAAYLMFKADIGHDEPDEEGDEPPAGENPTVANGGTDEQLPDDDGKLGPAGVDTTDEGDVTRVDRSGDSYEYSWSGYLERFGNYSVGGTFQGLAGFGSGELGIISQLRTDVPTRVAIGTNHIIVAATAILASVVHVFGGTILNVLGIHIPGVHALSLASTPWNMVVFTVPATVTGGQIAPYVSNALDTTVIQKGVGVLFTVISVALFLMASGGGL